MKISYDKKIDAKYIKVKEGKIAYTKKIQDWLLFDFAKDDSVLGVEILDASEHPIGISVISNAVVAKPLKTFMSENKPESVDVSLNGFDFGLDFKNLPVFNART